jgi:hypothetical protein
LRGAAPGRSITQVRVHRRARSFSVNSTAPASVHETLPTRYSVRASSDGAAVNGALIASTLSRCGTLTLGSPLSSASAHTTVAGASGCHCALAIPDFDIGRKVLVRHQPGVRTYRAADQDELTVRRGRRCREHCGSADRRALAAGGVDERELAGRVIVKQRLIVGAGQQILIGADRRGAAAMFLDVRTGWHAHSRSGTTRRRHEPAQHRTAIADPFTGRPKGRIQLCGGD